MLFIYYAANQNCYLFMQISFYLFQAAQVTSNAKKHLSLYCLSYYICSYYWESPNVSEIEDC